MGLLCVYPPMYVLSTLQNYILLSFLLVQNISWLGIQKIQEIKLLLLVRRHFFDNLQPAIIA
jgi:hypothetical protein